MAFLTVAQPIKAFGDWNMTSYDALYVIVKDAMKQMTKNRKTKNGFL